MADQPDLQVISGRLERGEIDSAQYLEQLMRFVAARVDCARAGLRVFIDLDAGRVLRCVAMYDAGLDRMVGAADIHHAEGSPYLARLRRDGHATATPAGDDDASVGALREYLEAAQVVALMDMGFSVNGVLFGTFSCEQAGTPRAWTQRQLQALRKIASRASLTLMHVVTSPFDTAPGALWDASSPNRLATMPMLKPVDPPEE